MSWFREHHPLVSATHTQPKPRAPPLLTQQQGMSSGRREPAAPRRQYVAQNSSLPPQHEYYAQQIAARQAKGDWPPRGDVVTGVAAGPTMMVPQQQAQQPGMMQMGGQVMMVHMGGQMMVVQQPQPHMMVVQQPQVMNVMVPQPQQVVMAPAQQQHVQTPPTPVEPASEPSPPPPAEPAAPSGAEQPAASRWAQPRPPPPSRKRPLHAHNPVEQTAVGSLADSEAGGKRFARASGKNPTSSWETPTCMLTARVRNADGSCTSQHAFLLKGAMVRSSDGARLAPMGWEDGVPLYQVAENHFLTPD